MSSPGKQIWLNCKYVSFHSRHEVSMRHLICIHPSGLHEWVKASLGFQIMGNPWCIFLDWVHVTITQKILDAILLKDWCWYYPPSNSCCCCYCGGHIKEVMIAALEIQSKALKFQKVMIKLDSMHSRTDLIMYFRACVKHLDLSWLAEVLLHHGIELHIVCFIH